MDAKDIGKILTDGQVVEIIMRELQIDRAEAIKLWYGSNTRLIIYKIGKNKTYISGQLCFEELMREQQGQFGILKQFLQGDGGVDEKEK